jgi:hypothetical protein
VFLVILLVMFLQHKTQLAGVKIGEAVFRRHYAYIWRKSLEQQTVRTF